MTKDTLFEILGEIDDDMITESENNIKKSNGSWLKLGALAACLFIAFAISIPFFKNTDAPKKEDDIENAVTEVTEQDKIISPVQKTKNNVFRKFENYTYANAEELAHNGNIIINDLGAPAICKKQPVATSHNEEMKQSEWSAIMDDFEALAGIQYYHFLYRVPEKWGYPKFSSFDYEENDVQKFEYVLEYDIDAPGSWMSINTNPNLKIIVASEQDIKTGICDAYRDYYPDKQDKSVINGTPVTAYKIYDTDYAASFFFNGAYYEVETENISKPYFIEILEWLTSPTTPEEKEGYTLLELPINHPMINDPLESEGGRAGLSRQYYAPEKINESWRVTEIFFAEAKTTYLTLSKSGDTLPGSTFFITPCVDNPTVTVIPSDDTDSVYNLPNIPLPACTQPGCEVIDTITVGDICFDMFYHNDDIWCHYTYEGEDYHIETKNVSKQEIIDLINILFGHHAASEVPADEVGVYAEAVNLDILSDVSLSIFCGSYLDENGEYTILVTETASDSDKDQLLSEICRTSENTTIMTAKYTMQYLTSLQKKISDAMSNNELPFVMSSGVYDDKNRIIVTVNTKDEAEYSKLYAFDTIGGAIEAEYSEESFTTLTEDLQAIVPNDILPDEAIPESE